MTRPKIRLLVVDDSVYMQMAIRMIIDTHPEIDIVGEAGDGEQALQMARSLAPDVITMDVNMPGMDGLEATRRIMAETPVPIIMLSSLTEKGVATTFRALELGAVDYVSKSSSAIEIDIATIAEQVAAKIKFWGRRTVRLDGVAHAAPPALPAQTDLLLIAAGAGGPSLVSRILHAAAALPFPVLISQDMPANFTAPFVEYLARTTGMKVHEGRDGCTLERGSVTVMPGARKGAVSRRNCGSLTLALAPAANAAGDAIAFGVGAANAPLVIVLSGEARPLDGLRLALGTGKGVLWVQAPATCVLDDLPRAALAMGLESVTCDPGQLAGALSLGTEMAAA